MKEDIFKLKLKGDTLVVIDWANVHGWFKDLKWKVNPEKLFQYLSSYPEVFEQRLYQGIEIGDTRSESFAELIKSIGFTFITKEVKFVPVSLEKSHFKKIIKELFDVLDVIKITNTEISTKMFDILQKIDSRLGDEDPQYESDGYGGVQVTGVFPAYKKEDEVVYNEIYSLLEELDVELKKLNINISDLQINLTRPIRRRKCDFDVEIARDVFNLSSRFDQLVLFSGDGDYSALVDDLISKGKKVVVVFASGHKGKEYKNQPGLFLCTVENLKPYISNDVKNIPPDFSGGRDIANVAKR